MQQSIQQQTVSVQPQVERQQANNYVQEGLQRTPVNGANQL
nr:hypothetical protein [Acinetobacter baumannii]